MVTGGYSALGRFTFVDLNNVRRFPERMSVFLLEWLSDPLAFICEVQPNQPRPLVPIIEVGDIDVANPLHRFLKGRVPSNEAPTFPHEIAYLEQSIGGQRANHLQRLFLHLRHWCRGIFLGDMPMNLSQIDPV